MQFDEHMLEAMWHQFVSDMQRGFAHWLAQGERNTRFKNARSTAFIPSVLHNFFALCSNELFLQRLKV